MAYIWAPYYVDTDSATPPTGYMILVSQACTPVIPVAQTLTRRASPVPEEVQPMTGGGSSTQGYATGG